MKEFKVIKPEDITNNPFTMIGKEWMLIGAADGTKVNAMTASWGGVGIMWGKPVVYAFIRETRYTKEFVDNNEGFSITIYPEDMRKMLSYMGSTSGRDEDKIEEMKLTTVFDGKVPYFEEADMALICRKMYAQDMKSECFTDKAADEQWYKDGNYHTMYVAEIEKVLISE